MWRVEVTKARSFMATMDHTDKTICGHQPTLFTLSHSKALAIKFDLMNFKDEKLALTMQVSYSFRGKDALHSTAYLHHLMKHGCLASSSTPCTAKECALSPRQGLHTCTSFPFLAFAFNVISGHAPQILMLVRQTLY